MPDWIKTSFTLDITQEDIDAANRLRLYKDSSYVCPSAKSARRLFPSCENARFSWGYGTVYYESEVHNFNVEEYQDQTLFEQNWGKGLPVTPCKFTITLKAIKQKPGMAATTPRKYSKKPGPTAKMGL
jgi:hypothetical protein